MYKKLRFQPPTNPTKPPTKINNIILTKGRHYEDGVYYTFHDIQKIKTYLRTQNSSYFNNE